MDMCINFLVIEIILRVVPKTNIIRNSELDSTIVHDNFNPSLRKFATQICGNP